MTPTLDIVIVNWNAGVQLRRCLESIETADRRGFELHRVVVVDNASSDSSADHLQPGTIPLCNIRNRKTVASLQRVTRVQRVAHPPIYCF